MSADRRRPESAPAGSADLPPAASLLSVPIFRAAARQQAAHRAGHAPAPEAPSAPPAQFQPQSAVEAGRAEVSVQPVQDTPVPTANGAPYAVVGGTNGGAQPADENAATRPALRAVDGADSYRTLLDYWRSLARQGRAAVEKLDAELIAARWPYAMLIRVPRGGVVDITHVFAPAPAAVETSTGAGQTSQHPFARDQASQISSWVLEIAQEAAGSRQPSRHTETFHQAGRPRRITAELLPCQADGDSADHLLLQLRDG